MTNIPSNRAARLLQPRLGRTTLPRPYAWNILVSIADIDFNDYKDFIDQIKMPIESRAYNETKEMYHDVKLDTFHGYGRNLVYTGFHDADCYQRSHDRHYIQRNMHTFSFTVTVTLPVTHTTTRAFRDISKNGLFVIEGAWSPETWNPDDIPHYTCIYQPSSDWHIRNTQQRKIMLNHTIVRMVPY